MRSILWATLTIVAALALLVAGVLVSLTARLHHTTYKAAAAVESVRLAQEAAIDLLLLRRQSDTRPLEEVAGDLERHLAEAERFVTSAREGELLVDARARVDAYLAGERARLTPAEMTARSADASRALDALVAINLSDARQAQAAATAWDQRAKIVGLVVPALLLAGVIAALLWLERRAFAPIFALAAVMHRFGKGDRAARARVTGPAEMREMSGRFNEMADALGAQRQAQLAFLGGVAHDLRNPLSALTLALASLPPDQPLPPEPRVRETLARLRRQLGRLERMAADFLDSANVESGELALRRERQDARALVHDVLTLFDEATPTPRVRVTLPDEPVELVCDPLRIEQVLTNLISNALKYSPSGSPVEVAVEPAADEVVLRVTDHGVGIPEAEQARVFEPFRRVGLSRESVPGVGLGLYVVRHIVEAHGGLIEVESAPGVGSTFRVRLPRALRAEAPEAHVVH